MTDTNKYKYFSRSPVTLLDFEYSKRAVLSATALVQYLKCSKHSLYNRYGITLRKI